MENHPFDIGEENPMHLTCSLGAAVFPFHANWPEKMGWERVVELADACLYAAQRSARNAWVGVVPTELATTADLSPDLTKQLAGVIQQGKLAIQTSLADHIPIRGEE